MVDNLLERRSAELEWMDERSIQDSRLTAALADLRTINRMLGGHSSTLISLAPLLKGAISGQTVRLLDIGCGGGDFVESLLRWGERRAADIPIEVTAVDNSPATIEWARMQATERLPVGLSSRITWVCCDAFSLPFADNTFDIAHASLFAHHFQSDRAVALLREMNRVAARGIVINDLHRHRIALAGISLLTTLFDASPMVRHDGPLSVRRAFTRDELQRIAAAAGIGKFSLTWRWAFRWLLTTVKMNDV